MALPLVGVEGLVVGADISPAMLALAGSGIEAAAGEDSVIDAARRVIE